MPCVVVFWKWVSKPHNKFTYFRIIGSQNYFAAFSDDKDLIKYDHWLYGYCNPKKDIRGIENVANFENFQDFACIRKYYNSTEGNYYDTDSPNFKWPTIDNGTHNSDYKFYNVFVKKCKEDTLNMILGNGYHCKNDSDIEKFIKKVVIGNFYFINHFVDILDYKNPIIKYFFKIESTFSLKSYRANHLNFDPLLIKTNNGLLFDNFVQEKAYSYERNDVFAEDRANNSFFCVYVLWLKNIMNYYERSYKKIQDAISSIGGISQFITIVASYINRLYNHYIILSDTQALLNSNIKKQKKIRKLFSKELKELDKKKIRKEIKESSERKNSLNKKEYNKSETKNNVNNISKNDVDISNSNNSKLDFKHNKNKINNSDIKNSEKISSNNNKFFEFILFKFNCKMKNNFFYIYENFRMKIISEEHLIKNHLNIYNILRVTEKNRNFRKNSYQLHELIKLV